MRILKCAVMVEITETEIVGHRVKRMLFQIVVAIARKSDRIDKGRCKGNIAFLCRMADKADIKVRIVRHENRFSGKRQKLRQNLAYVRRVSYHVVGNAGQFRNFGTDGHMRIDKALEGVENFAAAVQHRTDFGDGAVLDRKTGGFDIKDAKRVFIDLRGTASEHRRGGVVHKVGFNAVNDFEIGADLFGFSHDFGICLQIAVVGDGDGCMSEPRDRFDHSLRRKGGIHGGKRGV